jgi:hypothetical protein
MFLVKRSAKKGLDFMQKFQWIGILLLAAFLLSGCAPVNEAAMQDESAASPADLAPVFSIQSALARVVGKPAEPNECLKCHADKDRLIETGDPVEPIAESESKGVG